MNNEKIKYVPLIYNQHIYKDYEINPNGDIRNKNTKKILKQRIFNNGYYCVTLALGERGKVKNIRVHRALAEAFIPNPNHYQCVDHIDENKLNNNLENLQWVTYKENTNKHWKIELSNNPFCNNRKLTKEDVDYIRTHLEFSARYLAEIFNVSKTTIINVRNNYLYCNY